MNAEPTKPVRNSLERGLKILLLLQEIENDPVRWVNGLSVQQVANELGIHKSSASRLIQTLVQDGFAKRNPYSKRGFRLGDALSSRFPLTAQETLLRNTAEPYLRRISQNIRLVTHFGFIRDQEVMVIDSYQGKDGNIHVTDSARIIPVHCTSIGKCLLAFNEGHELAIPVELPYRTAKTIAAHDELVAHLEEIKSEGYAVDNEENQSGVCGISFPITNSQTNKTYGAVGVHTQVRKLATMQAPETAAQIREVAKLLAIEFEEATHNQ